MEEPSPSVSAVRGALDQVLSQHFRTSKQCQDLLRYIVDRSLSGDDASLRERVIGTEVFGRKTTYDTGEDPVVRVQLAGCAQTFGAVLPVRGLKGADGSDRASARLLPGPFPR